MTHCCASVTVFRPGRRKPDRVSIRHLGIGGGNGMSRRAFIRPPEAGSIPAIPVPPLAAGYSLRVAPATRGAW